MAILRDARNSHPKIARILLSNPDLSAEKPVFQLYPHAVTASCDEIDAVAEATQAFLDGEDRKIPLDVADWSVCSAFQQKVLLAEYGIPRGRVGTYKGIAEYVGSPNGARAVGTALARNPFPLIVPCHRAIRSDGHPGGSQGRSCDEAGAAGDGRGSFR